ncbi:hypothetical protein QJS04_geneDACA004798 [Acorus gramineus]|uniref:Uncharacterized protein n=1 Tax=Acorus gramineus TaxID=55184 RepID=A0AAV9BY69_ACOGR|nr:hypothetical protein QJS04_geneDACA004798 [Acorus gramineus]
MSNPFVRFPISRLFRQFEQEMETVINVLQPGPLGVVEHKFSEAEVVEARATVRRAVENWRRNTALEKASGRSESGSSRNG